MKVKMRKALILFILIFISNCLCAQNVKILTIEEAVAEALKNNSDIITARLEQIKAKNKVSETYNESLLPTLTLSTQYIRAFKKPVFDIFGQKYEIGTDNQITNTLSASEPIPFLGTPIFQGIRIAEYYAALQTENVAAVETKVKSEVKKAFYNVLLLKEVVEINKQSLQNALSNLEVVEKKYKAGTETEFNLLRARVKVENIKPSLSQSENNLSLAKKSLKNSIGIKSDEEIDVVGTLTYDSTEVIGSMDEILYKIAESNVAIRQLNISKKINDELVKIDNANYLPKLYLFGQYQLNASENDGKYFFNYRYFNVVNAGIGLSWNLNFISNSYKKQQSLVDVKKTEEMIIDTKNKLRLAGQSIIQTMEDAKNRIIANRENIRLAEKGYELAVTSFRNGVITQIDVLDAELILNQTRLAYVQSIYDYLKAKVELEQLLER
ncbi:MAG: TolC family protein [Ignavibacteria bacterium]